MHTQGNLPEQSGENKLCEFSESPERTTLSQAFKEKPCRNCGNGFIPKAPSQLYCGESCAEAGYDNAYYTRTYGITKAEFDRMWDKQGGRCAICEGGGFLMRSHHRKRLVIDHDHKTGQVRGLLCHNCNRALGLLKDDERTLQRALKYVSGKEGATTIP